MTDRCKFDSPPANPVLEDSDESAHISAAVEKAKLTRLITVAGDALTELRRDESIAKRFLRETVIDDLDAALTAIMPEPVAYNVISTVGHWEGETIGHVMYSKFRNGWQYQPRYQAGRSRKFWATANAALKGRVKDYRLVATA